jgi:hypothetical protein
LQFTAQHGACQSNATNGNRKRLFSTRLVSGRSRSPILPMKPKQSGAG